MNFLNGFLSLKDVEDLRYHRDRLDKTTRGKKASTNWHEDMKLRFLLNKVINGCDSMKNDPRTRLVKALEDIVDEKLEQFESKKIESQI